VRTIWVGIAGFFGAIARYSLGGFISARTTGAFPWETLAINVSGCFALGFIFTILTERFLPHPTRIALTGRLSHARSGGDPRLPVCASG